MKYQYILAWFVLGATMVIPILIFVRYNAYRVYSRQNNSFDITFLKPAETLGKIITRHKQFGWKILGEENCKQKKDFVLTKIMPLDVPIFVYPPELDIHISRMIINSGSWEAHLINQMVNVMKQHPDAVFIDIGSNIGIYSITMAALGYRVIAIDCFIENVNRVCASATLANITSKLSIIHNSVSDTRTELRLIKSSEPNVGGMEVGQMSSAQNSTRNFTSSSILLDDLLEIFPISKAVIKMDVEKHEDEILKGASKFFTEVVVESVLLEFRFHTKDSSGQFIIDFLDEHGLEPILPGVANKSNYKNWPGDLMWRRRHGVDQS